MTIKFCNGVLFRTSSGIKDKLFHWYNFYTCRGKTGEKEERKCTWNKGENDKFATFNGKKQKQKQKPTTPGIPRRSPIQVLTGPDAAWLRWSDENRYIQRGMVVGKGCVLLQHLCVRVIDYSMSKFTDFHFFPQAGTVPRPRPRAGAGLVLTTHLDPSHQ